MHACSTIKRFFLTIALLGIPQRLSWPVFPQRRLLCARCWRQVSAEEATKPRTDSPSPKQTPKHVLVKCPKPQNASCATCPRQVSAEGGKSHADRTSETRRGEQRPLPKWSKTTLLTLRRVLNHSIYRVMASVQNLK